MHNPTMTWNFKARMAHGCGCGGKKTVQRQTGQTVVSRTPAAATRAATAQTYQSATIKKAPQGAVTRRTV